MRDVVKGLGVFLLSATLAAQGPPDDIAALQVIRSEARDRSSAATYAFYLTDVYGPRLTGSSGFRQAAAYAVRTLTDIGADNVELLSASSVEWAEPGWDYGRYGVRLIEPQSAVLAAIPSPWSPPTSGRRIGEPVFFQTPGRSGLPVDEVMARYKGQLKDKILLLADQVRPAQDAWRPVSAAELTFRRFADADLLALRDPAPIAKPPSPSPAPPSPARPPRTREDEDNDTRKLYAFLRDEGAIAWLNPTIGDHGTIVAFGPFGRPGFEPPPPPGFNLSVESYNGFFV